MTNYEKYKEQIDKITRLGLGFGFDKTTDSIDYCSLIACKDCKFFGGCNVRKINWADEECKEPEPEVDWSKVAVDTPILVRNFENDEWRRRYFAGYRDGKVYSWRAGRTSWSTSGEASTISWEWEYAKLAEVEE